MRLAATRLFRRVAALSASLAGWPSALAKPTHSPPPGRKIAVPVCCVLSGKLPGPPVHITSAHDADSGLTAICRCRRLQSSGLRKKAFRTLLSLTVISPKGRELNTSGAERRSELTSPRGANLKGRKPVLSQGAERSIIKKLVFPTVLVNGFTTHAISLPSSRRRL